MKNFNLILRSFILLTLFSLQSVAQEQYCNINNHNAIDFNYDSEQQLYHIEHLDNGKTMLYGSSYYISGNYFNSAITRLNPDASLDTTFSNDGKLDYSINQRTSIYYGFTDFNGKVYAMGYTAPGNGLSSFKGALFRFHENGDIDSTFSGDGFTYPPSASYRYNIGGYISADSIITIVSTTNTNNLAVVKYNYDGTLYTNYSTNGHNTFTASNLYPSYNTTEFIPTTNGEFYIVSKRYVPSAASIRPIVLKFNAQAYLDTTFNGNGILNIPINTGDSFKNITGHYDEGLNKLYISTTNNSTNATFIARITPDGHLDSTYSNNGYLWSPTVTTSSITSWGITTHPITHDVIQFGKRLSKPYIFQTDSTGSPIETCGDTIKVFNLGYNYDHYFTNSYFKNGQLVLMGITGLQDDESTNIDQGSNFMTPINYCFLSNDAPTEIDTLICKGDVYPFNSMLLDQEGMYYDTLTNSFGCDSIIELNLEIESLDLNLTQHQDTLIAPFGYDNYNWINCNDHSLLGHTSPVFIAETNGSYACIISSETCSDTSDCLTIQGININEINHNDLTYYWSNNNLIFSSNHTIKSNSIKVNTILGQANTCTIDRIDPSTFRLDASNLQPGIYTLSFMDNFGLSTFKFIK